MDENVLKSYGTENPRFVGMTTYQIDELGLVNATYKAILSVKQQKSKEPILLMVVDTGSRYWDRESWRMPRNRGFALAKCAESNIAKSFNMIFKTGFTVTSTVMCLNNDVELEQGALEDTFNYAEQHPMEFIYGDYWKFSAFIMSWDLWREIGSFDENLPRAEDWDYYQRLKEANIPMVRYNGFKVKHKAGSTLKKIQDTDEEKQAYEKARVYWKKKWEPKGIPLGLKPMICKACQTTVWDYESTSGYCYPCYFKQMN